MNLVSFSIKTKGLPAFARRLWTVFTRFGITEKRTHRALYTMVDALRENNTGLTFFIPAVVLGRHPHLIKELADHGTEVGIHGYIHNDYRFLNKAEQHEQIQRAISVFEKTQISYQGFRHPYLGWTKESLQVFTELGFAYESNEAVDHEVIDLDRLAPHLKSGYEKSLVLFQAIPYSAYTLRPHFEGSLLRIPTSIPDDEMLYDRLRISSTEIGGIWSTILQRVYTFGGIYVLNLHPERGVLCKQALDTLLAHARNQPLPVWIAQLRDVALWWKERSQFKLHMTALAPDRWQVEAVCTPRATLLARHLVVEDQATSDFFASDKRIQARSFTVKATQCPCIGLSLQTSEQVVDFLQEQGYPAVRCLQEEAHSYSLYLDMPGGLGVGFEEQIQQRSALVQQIEQLEAPLLHFGNWPDGNRAALTISGDIDSVTVQDFFLRILEVRQKVNTHDYNLSPAH